MTDRVNWCLETFLAGLAVIIILVNTGLLCNVFNTAVLAKVDHDVEAKKESKVNEAQDATVRDYLCVLLCVCYITICAYYSIHSLSHLT